MSNAKSIHSIVIYDKRLPDGSHYSLQARLEASGHLVFEGYDTGSLVREVWGDSDYEYWIKIAPEHVPLVLLELLKERFEASDKVKQWLDSKNVPCDFSSWV